eukprot:CFRG2386T1
MVKLNLSSSLPDISQSNRHNHIIPSFANSLSGERTLSAQRNPCCIEKAFDTMVKPGQQQHAKPAHVIIDMGFGENDSTETKPLQNIRSYTDSVLHKRAHGSGRIGGAWSSTTSTTFLNTYPTLPHQKSSSSSFPAPSTTVLATPRSALRVRGHGIRAGGFGGGLSLSVRQKLKTLGATNNSNDGYNSDDAINSLAHRGRVVVKKGTLEWEYDISADSHGRTPLHIASSKGDLTSIRKLLGSKIYSDHSSKLHRQNSYSGIQSLSNPDIVNDSKFIDNYSDESATGVKIEVNARDRMGNTPLHLAACTANMGVMTELVRYGANPSLIDSRGKQPMHYVESRLKLLRTTLNPTNKAQLLEIYSFLQACSTTSELDCSEVLLNDATGMGRQMNISSSNVESLEAEDLGALLDGMVSMSLSKSDNI